MTEAFAEGLGVRYETPVGLNWDQKMNRIAQSGGGPSAAGGAGSPAPGSVASAMANNISVVTNGSGNTIVLNVNQTNTGSVVSVSALNGSLNLD